MDVNKDIKVLLEEDDGEEINSKKVTLEDIEAKEKEEEEQAKPVLTVEEQKAKDKKSNEITGIIIGCIVGIVAIAGIIVTVTKTNVIRELPFRLDGKSEADLNDVDYQEGDWYVANQQNYGISVRVTTMCNMYDKPTSVSNSIRTFNTDEEVLLLGDVFNKKTNELLDWYYIKADDKKGYIKSDNIEILFEDVEVYEEELPLSKEDKEQYDADKKEFYRKKLVEDMKKTNETANERASKAKEYKELSNRLIKLNKQINNKKNYILDEEGNEIEISGYEYSPEEMQSLLEEQAEVSEALEKLKEEMGMTVNNDE